MLDKVVARYISTLTDNMTRMPKVYLVVMTGCLDCVGHSPAKDSGTSKMAQNSPYLAAAGPLKLVNLD